MPSSTSLGLADALDVEVRVADRGKREAAAVEAAVEIVGAREEAEDVKTSSTRVQQKSQASVEWAGKIASDAELRQRGEALSRKLRNPYYYRSEFPEARESPPCAESPPGGFNVMKGDFDAFFDEA